MIRKISILSGMILLTAVALYAATPSATPSAAQTRADFERMAGKMPYLEIGSVLYDRPQRHFAPVDAKDNERHNKVLAEVADPKYSKDVLLSLLGHTDPKVRTLAAVALFDREDPSLLPALVKLATDTARTFDGYPILSAVDLSRGNRPPPKQTVGEVVRKMVCFYLNASGLFQSGTEKEFAEYWNARKDRSYCAGWLEVKLARASHGTSPLQKDWIDRVALSAVSSTNCPPMSVLGCCYGSASVGSLVMPW